MAGGSGIVAFVVCALAGAAHAQPGATPAPPPVPAPEPQAQPQQRPQHTLCFFGRPHECASVLLFEVGGRGNRNTAVTSLGVGLLVQDGMNAYGGTVGIAGITDAEDDIDVLGAGRYRRYLGTWGLSTELSVGYAGGPAVEVALGWGDVVAITAGLNLYDTEGGDDAVLAGVGVRVGAVAIGGVLYVTALVAAGAR